MERVRFQKYTLSLSEYFLGIFLYLYYYQYYMYPIFSYLLPYILYVCIALIIILTIKERKSLSKPFKTIPKHIWILLLITLFIGCSLRIFTVPHSSINIGDEYTTIFSARHLAQHGSWKLCYSYDTDGNCLRQTPDSQPAAPATLLSIPLFFNPSYETANATFLFLSCLSLLLLFLFAFLFFKSYLAALFATIFLSLTPIHIYLSATTAIRNASLTFLLLYLLFLFSYFRSKKTSHLILTLSALTLTIQTLPEFNFFIILFPILTFLFAKPLFKTKTLIISSSIFLIINIPYFIYFFIVSAGNYGWQVGSEFGQLHYLAQFLFPNIIYLLASTLIITSILLLMSLIYIKKKQILMYYT